MPDVELLQTCFLSRDKLRLGELIVAAEHNSKRRPACQAGGCFSIEL